LIAFELTPSAPLDASAKKSVAIRIGLSDNADDIESTIPHA